MATTTDKTGTGLFRGFTSLGPIHRLLFLAIVEIGACQPAPVAGVDGQAAGHGARAEFVGAGLDFGVEHASIEFGDLVEGQVVSGQVSAIVHGENGIVISGLRKSCGCTTANLFVVGVDSEPVPCLLGERLNSGDQLILKATVDTIGKRGDFDTGVVIETLLPSSEVVVSLSAQVSPGLVASSRNVDFGRVLSGGLATVSMQVRSPISDDFHLSIDSERLPEWISATVVPADGADASGTSGDWELRVSLNRSAPRGVINGGVRLVSDIPRRSSGEGASTKSFVDARLYVAGEVVGPAVLSPAHVSFGMVHPGQASSGVFAIEYSGALPDTASLDLVAGEGSSAASPFVLTHEFLPGSSASEQLVRLTVLVDEGLWRGSFQGELVVKTGCPGQPSLKLGYSGVVLDSTLPKATE